MNYDDISIEWCGTCKIYTRQEINRSDLKCVKCNKYNKLQSYEEAQHTYNTKHKQVIDAFIKNVLAKGIVYDQRHTFINRMSHK